MILNKKESLITLNLGDLIWAEMPLPKKELATIEESHRTRPYLIVKKDDGNLYGYQASHSDPYVLNNYKKYFVPAQLYSQKKDSFFLLDKVFKIPAYKIKSKFFTLSKKDLSAIQKRIVIQQNRNVKDLYDFEEEIRVEKNDIVLIDTTQYLIYQDDNTKFYCYKISKKFERINECTEVKINGSKYYVYFDEKVSFNRTQPLVLLDIATDTEMEYVNEKKDSLFVKGASEFNARRVMPKTQNHFKVGQLFNYKDLKLAYLFTTDGFSYFIDIENYRTTKRLVALKNNIRLEKDKECLPLRKTFSMIEFLYMKKTTPVAQLRDMYQKLDKHLN